MAVGKGSAAAIAAKKVREQFAERSKHLFEQPQPLRVVWYRSPWVRVAAALIPLLIVIWYFWPTREDIQPVAENQLKIEENNIPPITPNEETPTPVPPKTPTDTRKSELQPATKSLLAGLTSVPGQTAMGKGVGDPDSLLSKAEEIFQNNGSMETCYQLIQEQENAWGSSPPDDITVYLKLMVLKTLALDRLGRQEEAIRFLQAYIEDPTPRSGTELIWRDLPRLLQMLLQRPLDKIKTQEKLDELRAQQDGSRYINYVGPFLSDVEAWLKGQ